MQLTVDSTERVENVLRAVGGLYGVELQVVGGSPAISATPARRRGATPAKSTRGGARPGRRKGRPVRRSNAADIRTWARANGQQISDRGRIPDSVVTAYQQAQ